MRDGLACFECIRHRTQEVQKGNKQPAKGKSRRHELDEEAVDQDELARLIAGGI